MTDPTEDIRKQMLAEINADPGSRSTWKPSTASLGHRQLSEDFEVIGLQAPLVVVRRKSDGQKGSLMFQATPVLLRLRASPPLTLTTRAGKDACPINSENTWSTQCFAPLGSLGEPDMPENPTNNMTQNAIAEITQGSTGLQDRPPGPAGGAWTMRAGGT